MHYVYVLRSEKDQTIYVGLTGNLRKRMLEHEAGSGYTKGHLPLSLMFYAAFPDKIQAASFEKYLKTASGKAFINKRLIS